MWRVGRVLGEYLSKLEKPVLKTYHAWSFFDTEPSEMLSTRHSYGPQATDFYSERGYLTQLEAFPAIKPRDILSLREFLRELDLTFALNGCIIAIAYFLDTWFNSHNALCKSQIQTARSTRFMTDERNGPPPCAAESGALIGDMLSVVRTSFAMTKPADARRFDVVQFSVTMNIFNNELGSCFDCHESR